MVKRTTKRLKKGSKLEATKPLTKLLLRKAGGGSGPTGGIYLS